jgi:hypothetical protein
MIPWQLGEELPWSRVKQKLDNQCAFGAHGFMFYLYIGRITTMERISQQYGS